ncbi:MAG: hypothetical protein QW514_06050 [Thermoprotei archaeon]
MNYFYEKAGLVVFGEKEKRILTAKEVRELIHEMFVVYSEGCVLTQEAKLFFRRKGYKSDQAKAILLFGEEMGFLIHGCDNLENYVERLKRIGEYRNHLRWLASLGYTEEDGFVEVYARPIKNQGSGLDSES